MYYFAAAASLALIIGLFFLVKENSFKEDKNLAQNAPEKTEQIVTEQNGATEESQKVAEPDAGKKVPTEEVAESKGKEKSFKEGKLEETSTGKDLSNKMTTISAPTESENSVAANEKAGEYGWNNGTGAAAGGKMQNAKAEGKATMDEVSVVDQESTSGLAKTSTNKPEEKKAAHKKSGEASKNLEDATAVYKEADEKEKQRYESNTVWTSTPSAMGPGAVKQQTQTESKPKVADDNQAVAGSTTTANPAPVQAQMAQADISKTDKSYNANAATGEEQLKSEVVTTKSKRSNYKANRSKAKSPAYEPAPSREDKKDAAGYSYYSQTSTRDFTSPEFVGGLPALQQFISDNLEISAPEKQGTVGVEFTVNPDGSVDTSNVKVTQPIKDCNPCSNDVKDLVKKMPKWQPALENGKGKAYRQKMSVPYHSRASKK
jgi:hypothetical protein